MLFKPGPRERHATSARFHNSKFSSAVHMVCFAAVLTIVHLLFRISCVYPFLLVVQDNSAAVDKIDYECSNGEGWVETLASPVWSPENTDEACWSNSACQSGVCVVTNTTDVSLGHKVYTFAPHPQSFLFNMNKRGKVIHHFSSRCLNNLGYGGFTAGCLFSVKSNMIFFFRIFARRLVHRYVARGIYTSRWEATILRMLPRWTSRPSSLQWPAGKSCLGLEKSA